MRLRSSDTVLVRQRRAGSDHCLCSRPNRQARRDRRGKSRETGCRHRSRRRSRGRLWHRRLAGPSTRADRWARGEPGTRRCRRRDRRIRSPATADGEGRIGLYGYASGSWPPLDIPAVTKRASPCPARWAWSSASPMPTACRRPTGTRSRCPFGADASNPRPAPRWSRPPMLIVSSSAPVGRKRSCSPRDQRSSSGDAVVVHPVHLHR